MTNQGLFLTVLTIQILIEFCGASLWNKFFVDPCTLAPALYEDIYVGEN